MPKLDLPRSYQERIDTLRATKLQQTREKQALLGSMDHDDHGLVLPPPDRRKIEKTISSSGMPITDCLLDGFQIEPNHPSGGFYGPRASGENYRALLDCHPVYIDPVSSLAGAYMVNFRSYRKQHWNPDFTFPHLLPEIQKYQLLPGIGATQHFCQDLQIGLELGWQDILEKIHRFRAAAGPEKDGFYAGLEAVVRGIQGWIGRHVVEAERLAEGETDPLLRTNLLEMAAINTRLVSEPPGTFREACQWMLWYQMAARMYNGSGSLGRLDMLLQPFYERDIQAGILDDEEAVFHIACLLLRDTAYIQLGGPDETGRDVTSRVSYLVLEAGHRLRIPANVGICVGDSVDDGLLKRGVEIQFEDKTGFPKFLGVERTVEGFVRRGYPIELGRQRAYSGCHWSAIPGREYTMNDCVKINFAAVFEVAFQELAQALPDHPSTEQLWELFQQHLERAVDATARCLDFHLDHMHHVFPELVLDLLSHGPIETGEDASHGGVEFTNLCIDGAALATVADSFAAIEQRVEQEGRMNWSDLREHLQANWAGPEGARARRMMSSIPRYGSGGSRADWWAERIAKEFARLVVQKPTPNGFKMMPGIFSWANTIPLGKQVGATPNGRLSGSPISHGANPDPGFRRDGAPTAMARAIASVQPGFGNTAPMQMELDPMITREEGGVDLISNLIRTHFRLGGTQINLNIMDADLVLKAHQQPDLFPDLVVRVTGFSAYFASLSPEFRQLVVNRILQGNESHVG